MNDLLNDEILLQHNSQPIFQNQFFLALTNV